MARILVSYASKHGSTEQVACSIAGALRAAGHEVEFVAAASVDDVGDFDCTILGGSLYMGRWHADARRFVQRHHAALDQMLFAVFALGPLSLDEEDVAGSRHQLSGALSRLDIEPDLMTVFGGVVDPTKLRFPFTRMARTDARDWNAIHDWVTAVAGRLPSAQPHVTGVPQ